MILYWQRDEKRYQLNYQQMTANDISSLNDKS